MNRSRIVSIAIICFAVIAFFTIPSINANTKNKGKVVTFTKDIAPIFFKNCAECHRAGEAAPFSVMSYKDVRPWAKSIREKVASREMPPWHADAVYGHFKNDRRLTQKEIDTINAWVDGGAAEGRAVRFATRAEIRRRLVNRRSRPGPGNEGRVHDRSQRA